MRFNEVPCEELKNSLQKNTDHLKIFVLLLRQIQLQNASQIDEAVFESSMTKLNDVLQKFMQALPQEFWQNYMDEHLMEGLILNTAHEKGQIRKISRSCIANYVRQYKDLRPILLGFKEFGIVKNKNAYSKQCIILILPNLLNLDQSVISKDCQQFVDLLKQLYQIIQESDESEAELKKSTIKVISEMSKRFSQFDSIYSQVKNGSKFITPKKETPSKEERKVQQGTVAVHTKQKSQDLAFGFLDTLIYHRMLQQHNVQDKTKAFDECLSALITFKNQNQMKLSEMLQFLSNFFQVPLAKSVNIAKLTNMITYKLLDNNKVIRQEAQQYFQSIQKMTGLRSYAFMIINLFENFCNNQTNINTQNSLLDALLNITLSFSQKVKGRDDIDYHKLVETLDSVWEIDHKHQPKIIDILHILSGSLIGQQEIINESKNLFNNQFHSKLEEKLGVAKESYRRNTNGQLNVNSLSIPQFDKPESSQKKKQLILPNINHLQTHSPGKTNQSSVGSVSQSTLNHKKLIQNEYFSQKDAITTSHLQQTIDYDNETSSTISQMKHQPKRLITNRYDSQTITEKSHSPFTTTTMSSVSDRLQLLKKKSGPDVDNNSDQSSNFGNTTQTSRGSQKIIKESIDMQNSGGFEQNQIKVGKLQLDPSFFQQTNGSLSGSIDQFSTKISHHKPGSGFTTKSIKFMRGTVTSLGDGSNNGDTKQYLTIGELEPLVNCDLEWKMFLGDIKSDNWSRQFEACNILRRACKFHIKDIIYGGKGGSTQGLSKQIMETFHEVNQLVVKLVDSLRSTVSKQAMITMYEMFESLPKQLIEQDLDIIYQVLLKRSVDTNGFVAEEAEKTLISMCRAVSEQKMANALLQQKSSKSSVIRCQICRCLCVIIIKLKQSQHQKKLNPNKLSDNERNILSQIGQYMSDAAVEVRTQAKASIKQIVNLFDEKELKNQVMMSMGETFYNKVIEYIDNECV
ncbi:protein fam179b-like [Stylonychia lemnae]|uniref:Protein fam179b-like n=1 Tax=Stylonychia lemnae TaxID=5949 RepID=A0A078A735_STYLE|nr:protein fam179b-like [Stylonychia lemnae]|eukprot:CDW78065.1 protein fam179b-like [Stylonychia lemnae]